MTVARAVTCEVIRTSSFSYRSYFHLYQMFRRISEISYLLSNSPAPLIAFKESSLSGSKVTEAVKTSRVRQKVVEVEDIKFTRLDGAVLTRTGEGRFFVFIKGEDEDKERKRKNWDILSAHTQPVYHPILFHLTYIRESRLNYEGENSYTITHTHTLSIILFHHLRIVFDNIKCLRVVCSLDAKAGIFFYHSLEQFNAFLGSTFPCFDDRVWKKIILRFGGAWQSHNEIAFVCFDNENAIYFIGFNFLCESICWELIPTWQDFRKDFMKLGILNPFRMITKAGLVWKEKLSHAKTKLNISTLSSIWWIPWSFSLRTIFDRQWSELTSSHEITAVPPKSFQGKTFLWTVFLGKISSYCNETWILCDESFNGFAAHEFVVVSDAEYLSHLALECLWSHMENSYLWSSKSFVPLCGLERSEKFFIRLIRSHLQLTYFNLRFRLQLNLLLVW